MRFDNGAVRRQDRLLDERGALELLRTGEWGVLSLCDEGNAYGIPLNYVWDGAESIYIHCAPEGRKLNAIALCGRVSFCVVGKTNVVSDRFTTEYESIVLACEAHTGLSGDERMEALRLIIEKYSPDDKETGLKYAEASFARTEIIRLDIGSWSAKTKNIAKMTK